MIDGVDALAVEMERKWGVGRLRLLVNDGLREKFDRQRLKMNHAIWHGDLDDVRTEAARMTTAWRALDQAATAAGAAHLSPVVLETALSDGTLIAIVRDNVDAAAVTADGRKAQLWTLEEVARVIEAFPAIVKAKELWPGAAVVATRTPDDPLVNIDEETLFDEIPF